MANSQIMIKIITISSFLLVSFSCTSAVRLNPAQKQHTDVVVEVVVFCQRCHLNGTSSLKDAIPIAGATISVICKDKSKKQSFYKEFSADQTGYVYAQLDGFKMGNSLLEHPLQACNVKLVSSPPEISCNVATNINYGVHGKDEGAPLRYLNKRLIRGDYEAVIYTAGPLAFCPARCMENQF